MYTRIFSNSFYKPGWLGHLDFGGMANLFLS